MFKSSDVFENDCIPMSWQIQGWREDLYVPLQGNPRSATAASGWWFNVCDVLGVSCRCIWPSS